MSEPSAPTTDGTAPSNNNSQPAFGRVGHAMPEAAHSQPAPTEQPTTQSEPIKPTSQEENTLELLKLSHQEPLTEELPTTLTKNCSRPCPAEQRSAMLYIFGSIDV